MPKSKILKSTLKAAILYIIVALLIAIIIIFTVNIILGAKVGTAVDIINKVAVEEKKEKVNVPKATINNEKKQLKNYPEYGTKYATINIPKIDINLPVYFGDTLEVLKNGVGHSSGSYFPGEGGSIIYMGHNSKKVFRRFSELKKGDKITITTDYGKYTYKIYNMQIVNETDTDKTPIQKEKEILMIYTCYPFNNIGYATQRYVVYADLEK